LKILTANLRYSTLVVRLLLMVLMAAAMTIRIIMMVRIRKRKNARLPFEFFGFAQQNSLL
jgi:hypothetical protein